MGQNLNKFLSVVNLGSLTMEELRDLNRLVVQEVRFRETLTGRQFRPGETVSFVGKYGEKHEGIVLKVNSKSVKVKVGDTTWAVTPSLLTRAA